MKKMILMLFVLFGFSMAAEVPDSLLTPAQRAMVEVNNKVQEAKATQAAASSYIGIGKEVGTAVRESMSAITEETNKLANTSVGHLLIFVILYKLLSSLVLSLIASFLTLLVTWSFYITASILGWRWYVKTSDEHYIDNNKDIWYGVTIGGGVIAIIITLVSVWNIG